MPLTTAPANPVPLAAAWPPKGPASRNIAVFGGPANWVMSAGFLGDGQFVYSASLDHTVRVYEAATGRQRANFDVGAVPRFLAGKPQASRDGALLLVPTFDGLVYAGQWQGPVSFHVLPVSTVVKVTRAALAPDNDHVLTGHINGTVRVSSLSVLGDVVDLAGTPTGDLVACVAFSRDGHYAAAATAAGKIRLWDLTRPQEPIVLPAHADWVNTVEFSANGQLLASCSDDKTARLFSVPDGRLVAELTTHTDRVISAVFSHAGDLLATAGVDKRVHVSDTRTGELRAVVHGPADEVQSVVFSPDDRLLAVPSVDGTCRICYSRNGSTLFELNDHRGAVFTAAFNTAGNLLLTASADLTARLWNVDTGHVFWDHHGQVNTAVFSHNGRNVATTCEDGVARVFETLDGSQATLVADHEGAVNSAAFSPDDTLLVTTGQDRAAQVTAWQSGDTLAVLPHDLEVDAAVFTTDPDQVVTSTRHEAVLWQWRTAQRLATFSPPAEERAANPFTAIIGVDISRDNSTVVTAHYQYARTWDVTTGTQLAALWHAGIVYTAVFNDAGDQVVTSNGGDGNVRVWDARTGQLLRTLAGPSRQLRCAALSPDGRWAAGADAAGTVTLWSVINEQVAAVFRQHAETIMSIVFSPDSALLLTASDDWTAKAVAVGSLNPVKELV
jgi:WD40 repeat protein